MRVPFPLALNIGTDIIAIQRIIKPQSSFPIRLRRLAHRFLHPREIGDLDERHPQWEKLQTSDFEAQRKIGTWLAGRWAAKEAAKKAWGAEFISFKDLRIEVLDSGEVQVVCQSYDDSKDGSPSNDSAEQVGKLSISHDGDYAIATVIAAPLHTDILAELKRRKAAAAQKVKQPDPVREAES